MWKYVHIIEVIVKLKVTYFFSETRCIIIIHNAECKTLTGLKQDFQLKQMFHHRKAHETTVPVSHAAKWCQYLSSTSSTHNLALMPAVL